MLNNNDWLYITSVLNSGGIIAYPTESVWGLGCDPWNEQAVFRLLDIKRRSVNKGLIIIAATLAQVNPLIIGLTEKKLSKLLSSSEKKPQTWTINDYKNWIPTWIKGSYSSVALRICAHPIAKKACFEFGKPLVSTSANISGCSLIYSRDDIVKQFNDKVDVILHGETGKVSRPSCIKDIETEQVYR